MAKILSFDSSNNSSELQNNSEESFFKKLWESFQSLDKFNKIFILFILLFTITVPIVTKEYLDTRQRAQETPITPPFPIASPPRGISGDFWADIIIGKPNFSEVVPNTVVSNKLFLPHSIIVDRSVSPNRLYIYDGGNSRILGISDINRCVNQAPNCTVSKEQGDIVIGQPNFNSATCNGDSGFQNYPNRAPASASSFCSIPEKQLSIVEHSTGSSMHVDSQGNLYLNDMDNHRVLKYNNPFTTDTIADDVWGQNDFTGNECNKGKADPDATSLCTNWSGNNNWIAGVEVDTAGNLWVTDSSNNRVLRFPSGSHTADLVLGQPNFTSKTSGNELNQLFAPAAVRVNNKGWAYVADYNNHRVMVYENPVTGASGRVFASQISSIPFKYPEGIDLDPTQPGKIWIAQRGYNNVELWDEETQTLQKTLGVKNSGNILNNTSGSIGIDSSGNYYVAVPYGNYGDEIVYYQSSGPYDYPTKKLFDGRNVFNLRTGAGLTSGGSIALYQDSTTTQLIVLDVARILFWNDLNSLSNGKAADGVLELSANDFSGISPSGGFTWIKASKKHLYAGRGKHNLPVRIETYDLPLISGQKPNPTYLSFPFNVLGGGQIDTNNPYAGFSGLSPAEDDSFLWVSDASTNRVFRIRNPLTNPVVDVILGQKDNTGILCNQGRSTRLDGGWPRIDATPSTLCLPGELSFDRLGNLYVSDHSLEIQGNMRLVVFKKDLFPVNNTQVIYAPEASKIFPDIATWEPAFDLNNRMVVGFNHYWAANPKEGWFPAIYNDPLGSSTTPSFFLNDYFSMASSAVFDENNNLYIGDGPRGRVLIYKNPLDNSVPTPTTSPTPPPPTRLNLNLYLDGIGFKSRTYDNKNPLNKKRNLVLQVFDLNNNLLLEKTGEVNYSDSTGTFKDIVDLGYTLKTGTYNVKIRMEKYLKKSIKNIQVNANTDNTTSETALLPGDINIVKDQSGNTIVGDNKVNLQDYQTFYSCLSSTTADCINKADLNSDNIVNLSDYSLLMKNYGKVGD